MLTFFLISLIVGVMLWDVFNKWRINKHLNQNGIKGPKIALPVIGDIWITIGNDTANVFNLFRYFRDKYGKVSRLWIFRELFIVVQDVQLLESILRSPRLIRKNFIYDMLRDWLTDGLLISWGHKWHVRRKAITPSFHFTILEQFIEVFDQQSRIFVKRLKGKADGKTVINLFPDVCLTALDVITEAAMGVKINAQGNPDVPYVKALAKVADIIAKRMTQPVYYYNSLYSITHFLEKITLKRNIQIMHAFTERIITKRRRFLIKKQFENNHNHKALECLQDDVDIKKRIAFLDLLLQVRVDGQPLSNKDVCEEVDTFMFEGHDTTTSAISYTCYLLARHPNVQAKLLTEIQQVYGDMDQTEPITMKKLQQLKYLECVIKETLRLYPSVPIITRLVEEECRIDDLVLPAGTHVLIPLYAAAQDCKNFAQPMDFIPERFLPEFSVKNNPYAYVPFSAGPRNCIGQKFAMLEMKCIISRLIHHYELLPLGPDVVPVMNLILRSATGINVGLRPRVL